jgi:rare lipoprotein A
MKVWSSINPGSKSVLPILVSIFLMGCASSKGPVRPGYDRGSGGYPAGSRERAVGFTETGIISFYADKFHGRKTANGETFNMHAFTAAHRTLPFHSKVRVTNLANGKSVVVEVNDRGPFAANRILDLSPAAARKIDLIKSGTTKATVTVE